MKKQPLNFVWLTLISMMVLLSGCKSPLLDVQKKHISGETVGGEFHYQLKVRATENVANVMIEESLPPDVTFVRSDPAPSKQSGNKVTWTFPSMNSSEERLFDLYYTSKTEGEFHVCTAVTAMSRYCTPLVATAPKIEVSKTGPDLVELGSEATWMITVNNYGSGVAENVRVKDVLPKAFTSSTPVEQVIGDIEPGDSRSVYVTATAKEQGDFMNVANITWDGFLGSIDAKVPVKVIKTMVKINKVGPKEAYIFSPASFTSTIQNVGEAELMDLVITEHIPAGATVVDGGGGSVSGDRVVWKLKSLQPGESKSYNIKITANKPGSSMNRVTVDTARGHHEEAQVETNYFSAPGLSTSLVDERDPIQVGEMTVFVGRLANTSQFKPITGALVRVLVSPELQPVAISGDIEGGVIRGQEVLFSNVSIEPGQSITIKVQSKGVKAGPGGAVMQVKADFLPKVISNEESTTVVGE